MANWVLMLELMRLAAASMETVTRTLERLTLHPHSARVQLRSMHNF